MVYGLCMSGLRTESCARSLSISAGIRWVNCLSRKSPVTLR